MWGSVVILGTKQAQLHPPANSFTGMAQGSDLLLHCKKNIQNIRLYICLYSDMVKKPHFKFPNLYLVFRQYIDFNVYLEEKSKFKLSKTICNVLKYPQFHKYIQS